MKQFTGSLVYLHWLFLLLAFVGCSPSLLQIPAKGQLMGQTLESTVDSEIAKYYLENYLQNKPNNPIFDRKVDQIYQQYSHQPSREDLKKISEAHSVDFAALFLAIRLWEVEANKDIQVFFQQKVEERRIAIQRGETQWIPRASAYLILFVPGWNYQENGHITGADFSVPRNLINELGIENYLVAINPTGSVEENAEFLAKDIVRYGETRKRIMLVGASSAGPAIHFALSKQLTVQQLQPVKAWVNLGGILQGSPLIDYLQEWPKSWFFQIVLWFKGWEKENVLSMSVEKSRQRFQGLTIPKHILVVNYLGLPLSGQISRYSHDKYQILRKEGPNDGLTLLTDIISPGSMNIVALGSDHFFAEDPEINIKTVAFAQTIIQYLETRSRY